jgi:riboflavin kinase / FMN adenylyltransferase
MKFLYIFIPHQFSSLTMNTTNRISTGKNNELPADVSDMITGGDTAGALGRMGMAYVLTGRVVEGNKIGRTLGYPTANLEHPESIILPGQGVYTAFVYYNRQWYQSMVNVGIRPTLNLHHVTIEAHLFSFNGNIYGETISIHFLEKIRDEMRFNSLSELKVQLNADNEHARRAIAAITPRLKLTSDGLCLLKQR